ncbi:MAG: hypothetical protein GY749_05115 [Desulfobacteraceae bacterium]|nr:hypothetical protein [Desulfobacteraceae bacterium]
MKFKNLSVYLILITLLFFLIIINGCGTTNNYGYSTCGEEGDGCDDKPCCPWIYVYNGSVYKRRLEIIRNLNSEILESTEKSRLGKVYVSDGLILIQIREEEDEISYIDLINLEIKGVIIKPEIDSEAAEKIKDIDGDYLIMNKNDSYSFAFDASAVEKHISESDINIIAKGYYIRINTMSDN